MKPKVRTSRRFAGGRNLLVSLTPGPVVEGDTSQGLTDHAWCFWVDPQGVIRQQRAGLEALSPDAPSPSFLSGFDGRRLTNIKGGFDQNGQRVIALTEGSSVTVSYLIPGPTTTEGRVIFPGCDAVVFWDGLMRDYGRGEPTDVGIYYLSPDRLRLCYRLQLESYAVERTLAVLEKPCSLDAIARSGLRVAFYLGPKGSKTGIALVSENYPARARDAMSLSTSLVGGENFEVVVERDPITERLSLAVGLVGGSLVEPMVQRDPVTERLALGVALQGGTHSIVIVQQDAILERMSLDTALVSGASATVTVDGGAFLESLSLSVALQGGSIA